MNIYFNLNIFLYIQYSNKFRIIKALLRTSLFEEKYLKG